MAECMTAQITAQIITKLGAIAGYGALTIEQERITPYINGRYPYISLVGPHTAYETKFNKITSMEVAFTVKWFSAEEESKDTSPITYQNRNVNRDIIVALKADQSLNGLSQAIDIVEDSYDMEFVANRIAYFNYVSFVVSTVIDDKDLTLYE